MTDRTHSVQEILRTAASNVAALEDHDLAAHLDDLANDYAGPPADPELAATLRDMASDYAGPLLSPAYAYQKDAG